MGEAFAKAPRVEAGSKGRGKGKKGKPASKDARGTGRWEDQSHWDDSKTQSQWDPETSPSWEENEEQDQARDAQWQQSSRPKQAPSQWETHQTAKTVLRGAPTGPPGLQGWNDGHARPAQRDVRIAPSGWESTFGGPASSETRTYNTGGFGGPPSRDSGPDEGWSPFRPWPAARPHGGGWEPTSSTSNPATDRWSSGVTLTSRQASSSAASQWERTMENTGTPNWGTNPSQNTLHWGDRPEGRGWF